MSKDWKISVIYHIEAINQIVQCAKDNNITLLPISGAWLCLYVKEIFNIVDLDLYPEFIVNEEDYKNLTANFILDDKFILRSEGKNLNRFAIKIGKDTLHFNIYKKIDSKRDCYADLPTLKIWNRSEIHQSIRVPKFEDGLLTLFWRYYHLLFKKESRHKTVNFIDLINKADRNILIEKSADYNLQRFTKILITKPPIKHVSFIKSELLKKMIIKLLYSDNKFHYGFYSFSDFIVKWINKNIGAVKSKVIKVFAKSFIIKKEIGTKENEIRLLSRLGANWKLDKEIGGQYLISTSSGLWYLKGKQISMILPGGCFGITGGPEKWYVCQYTGDYSRILEFTLFEKNNRILLLERNNYLVGLSPNIHQIDLYKNRLYIVNAEENSILVSSEPGKVKEYFPNKKIKKGSKKSNHFNSVFINNKNVFVMAHNGTSKNMKDSEIYKLKRETLKTVSIEKINAQKAHNIFFLNAKCGFCNSPKGELIVDNKVIFKNENYFLRGVAVNTNSIIVGGSEFATRENRDKTSSMIFELDYNGNVKTEMFLKNIGQIYDIRYVGPDLAMSRYSE